MGPTWGRQDPGGPDIGPIDLPIRVKFLPSFYWACVYLPTVWLKLTRISESGPRCLLRLPLNTLRPGQNGHHFSDDIFKSIFLNENVWISVKIILKFVPEGPINNITALVQKMAWRPPGDKPLYEPMIVTVRTHICVTRLQWVNFVLYVEFVTLNVRPVQFGLTKFNSMPVKALKIFS